jgi:S-adenosylmethionine:tRNA ribosyltransferase-isomerase
MISRILASQTSAGRRAGVQAGRKSTGGSLGLGSRRFKHTTVSLQLDYYMSTQFAGIACAMVDGLYDKAGIELRFLPICPVGLEMERVRQHRNDNASTDDLVVGSVEQNIFTPLLFKSPQLKVKSVAAMFRTSPLCLASVGYNDKDGENIIEDMNNNNPLVIGAHEDTVSLLKRILEQNQQRTSVVASPRATKISDLLEGRVDRIQAYATTEVPTLERRIGGGTNGSSAISTVSSTPLEGLNGAKLGYSQVLFAPEEDLSCQESGDKREILQQFLDATFTGWGSAVRNHEHAARSVEEAKAMLGLDDETNDHWDPSFEYTIQSVGLCGDYVKETFQGDKYGVIDSKRWNEATEWLLDDGTNNKAETDFGFDSTVWQPPSKILAGNELARTALDDAKESAIAFHKKHGRRPSLAVITVGQLSRYTHSDRRLKIYSNNRNSWFNKTSTGDNHGFDVKEIDLPENTTTEELLSQVYLSKDFDGIQLMWPLPDHIDSGRAYNAIAVDQDVDGAHYIGQLETDPTSSPLPPVTPAATMELMDRYNIDPKGKNVLVVGRSRIVGSPMAHMLRARDAAVTVAHSEISSDDLESMVGSADIVVSCVGDPGVMKASWLKEDAEVINIGTTFSEEHDRLLSDFEGDLSVAAKRFSPVPGGVGPLSVAQLYKNVVRAAWERSAKTGEVDATWRRKSASLQRSIHFEDYDSALRFVSKVNVMSSEMDHHANISFTHKCINGVDVDMEYFSFEANDLTDKDYEAARKVNNILSEEEVHKAVAIPLETDQIKMSDFTYNLQDDSIAKYPANPRGSSRILNVDASGNVNYFDNFSDSILPLLSGAHVVFNESKVVNARLSVNSDKDPEKNATEMMILDLGEVLQKPCQGVELTVMIRNEGVVSGDQFKVDGNDSVSFHVKSVKGPWIEDEKSHGNGTECTVECSIQDQSIPSVSELLRSIGSVPIPPYLDRDAEASDESSYNNVFAAGEGSVAAPTAGLHFTDSLLAQVGKENISYLSLHVGAGTFKPVVAEDARDHAMHGESFVVAVGELQRIIESLESQKRLVVVGTTSSRTLESLYWCGVKKILMDRSIEEEMKVLSLHKLSDSEMSCLKTMKEGKLSDDDTTILDQHEWMNLESIIERKGLVITAVDALKAVIGEKSSEETVNGRTSLMIVPGYKFKVVEDLITNFHAPDSTLMLLVSAFLGNAKKVRSAYEDAQDRGYKFLSYGDACFFSRPKK